MGCLKYCSNNQVRTELDDKGLPGTFEFTDFPDDQYLCPVKDCNEIPEIIDIFSDYGYIEMKCKIHKVILCSIKEFYENTKNKTYLNKECQYCPNRAQGKDNILNYCSYCGKEFCNICEKKHEKNHKNYCIKLNKKPYKCLAHIDAEINDYCEDCRENVCDREKSTKHKKHKIMKFYKYTEEINDYINIIEEENKELVDMIGFNNIIIKCYENYPNNYFNLQNFLYLGNQIKTEEEKGKLYSEYFDCILHNLEIKLKEQNNAIKELQDKYEIKLSENDEEINLENKNIDDKILELISKINFKNLKKLNLSYNKIKYIEPLKYMNLNHLRKMDLSFNKIENISIFEELDLPELKELNFNNNEINNFDPLINSDGFPNLERLEYKNNVIQKDFKELEEKLKNKYKKLNEVRTKEEFESKYKITFGETLKISDTQYGNEIFKDLYNIIEKNIIIKELILKNNNITDCRLLSIIPLPNLEQLDLSHNKIENLDFLKNMAMPKLIKIILNNNSIKGLIPLKEIKKLKELGKGEKKLESILLENNEIDNDDGKTILILKLLKKKNIETGL